jgi:hypothetical protein
VGAFVGEEDDNDAMLYENETIEDEDAPITEALT